MRAPRHCDWFKERAHDQAKPIRANESQLLNFDRNHEKRVHFLSFWWHCRGSAGGWLSFSNLGRADLRLDLIQREVELKKRERTGP